MSGTCSPAGLGVPKNGWALAPPASSYCAVMDETLRLSGISLYRIWTRLRRSCLLIDMSDCFGVPAVRLFQHHWAAARIRLAVKSDSEAMRRARR